MSEIKLTDIPIIGFSGADVPDSGVINTCVHCGLCLPACPTYRITGSELSSPRGRIYLMKGVSEGRVSLDDGVFVDQMSQCLNCRACEAVCPSGVQYGGILEASRAQIQRIRDSGHEMTNLPPTTQVRTAIKTPIGERLIRRFVFGALFKNMGLFRAFSGGMKIYQKIGLQTFARKTGLIKLFGMAESEAMLPAISKQFTVPTGQVFAASAGIKPTRRVALMPGCIMSTVFAHVHDATIRVLQKNGCDVVLPGGQGCCGALHTHGGDMDGGRELARKNIAAMEAAGLDNFEAIIINAAGCGSTLKEYAHMLRDDPAWHARAERFVAKVRDIHEFLAAIVLNTADLKPLPLVVTYQEPCHMAHAQRITTQPRKLLKSIPLLKLIEMQESAMCCGSAGIYNLTEPEMAGQLGSRKVSNALATGASVIATGNPGCAMQLANELRKAGKHVQVKYVVELLDESYRGQTDA